MLIVLLVIGLLVTLIVMVHRQTDVLKGQNPLTCPKCGKITPPTSVVCQNCGFRIRDALDMICPKCEREYVAGTAYCPRCGVPLREKIRGPRPRQTWEPAGEIPEGMHVCPDCGARVMDREERCYRCGNRKEPRSGQ